MGGASRFIMLLTTPFPLLHHSRPSLVRIARYCRLCSSFSSLPHLNNSPASRLRSVSPVKSSEKIHTQISGVQEDQFGFSSNPPTPSHPWPEWSKFIETLSNSGHFEQQRLPEDEFVAYADVSEEFVRSSSACLAFARERWELLGSLSRREMMAIVENGIPFIFKSALDTSRRMRAFLGIGGSNVLESDKAHTVDLMKYLLSYASNPVVSPEKSGHYRGELIEASVRNLLNELCRLNNGIVVTEHPASVHNHLPDRHEMLPMAPQQNITMKRGDWICSRCSFTNFARNSKCIECEEMRPKRQLTGGEWECPQCDFYNYGRNVVCLRCDCKRPGDTSVTSTSPGLGYRNEVSAASEDDAQHWVTKISQMVSSSGMASTANDMNFKKTKLDRRRLANSQYRKNLDDDGLVHNSNFQVKGGNDTPSSRKIVEILGHQPTPSEADEIDEILGHQPPLSEADEILGHQPTPSEADEIDEVLGHQPNLSEADEIDDMLGHHPTLSEADEINSCDRQNAGTDRTQPAFFSSPQKNYPKGNNSSYVPFVPLPNDMFAKKPRDLDAENEKMVPESTISNSSKSTASVNQPEREDKEKPEADKSGSWLDKIAKLHNVKDLSSAIPDEDFPDIMPMRKGENRFVVSKKKDRSLTTPMYKRKTAMEQTGSPSFVPFVPFPPDYFAKKNKQPGAAANPGSAPKATSETSSTSENHPAIEKTGNQPRTVNYAASGRNGGSVIEPPVVRSSRLRDSISHNRDSISQQPDVGSGGWKGKSLEGSAVEEPDPLDMSEEAKAQRWFRRVAQIKDISELSDIPDEDFPSIMPMRKGVNRFVVSKRKTPLERRLTFSQYRQNSDPFKNGNDSS